MKHKTLTERAEAWAQQQATLSPSRSAARGWLAGHRAGIRQGHADRHNVVVYHVCATLEAEAKLRKIRERVELGLQHDPVLEPRTNLRAALRDVYQLAGGTGEV